MKHCMGNALLMVLQRCYDLEVKTSFFISHTQAYAISHIPLVNALTD